MTRSPRIEAPSAAARASVGPATRAGSYTCWTMTSGKDPASGWDSAKFGTDSLPAPMCTQPCLAGGGPSMTVGMYSSSCERPSNVRLSTNSKATSG